MTKTRCVLITGASRGIGKSIAKVFAISGYNVVVNYKNSQDSAFKLVLELNELGADAIPVCADISNVHDVRYMMSTALDRFSHIDVLINNAGISHYSLFTDTKYDDYREVFDVNIGGTYNCCRAIIPHMIQNHQGSIINISSMWGQVGASCEVLYSASKAAVIGLTKSLAKEMGLSGIRVNCIAPGVILTDMNKDISPEILEHLKDQSALNTLGTPEDVANAALFLASDSSSFITGQILGVNGGLII